MFLRRFTLIISSVIPLLVVEPVQGTAWRWFCGLVDRNELITVAKDPETGLFVPIDVSTLDDDSMQPQQRDLLLAIKGEEKDESSFLTTTVFLQEEEELIVDDDTVDYVPAFQLMDGRHRRMVDNNEEDDWPIYQARECHCHDDDVNWYCPSNYSTCAIPSTRYSTRRQPGCFNPKRNVIFARNAIYIIIGAYALLLACLFCTRMGRSIFGYIITCCWRGYNDKVARWLMEKKPEEARRMLYISWRRRRMQLEREYLRAMRNRSPEEIAAAEQARRREEEEAAAAAAELRRPTSLVLRTCKYSDLKDKMKSNPEVTSSDEKKTKNTTLEDGENEEHQDAAVCTICFGPFQDDDRVGALPCDHIFHVEPCLKSWLSRRNTCPLCVKQNVATPRYGEEEQGEGPDKSTSPVDGSSSTTNSISSISEELGSSDEPTATVVDLPPSTEPVQVLLSSSQSREFV